MVGRLAQWAGDGLMAGALSGALRGAGAGGVVGAGVGGFGSIFNPDQNIAGGVIGGGIQGAAFGGAVGGIGGRLADTSARNQLNQFVNSYKRSGGKMTPQNSEGVSRMRTAQMKNKSSSATERISQDSFEKGIGIQLNTKGAQHFQESRNFSEHLRNRMQSTIGISGIGVGAATVGGAAAIGGAHSGFFGSSNKRHTTIRSNTIPAGF